MKDYIFPETPKPITIKIDNNLNEYENILLAIKEVNGDTTDIDLLNLNNIDFCNLINLIDDYALIKVVGNEKLGIEHNQFYRYKKSNIANNNLYTEIIGTEEAPLDFPGINKIKSEDLTDEEKNKILEYLNIIDSENFIFKREWVPENEVYFYINLKPKENNLLYCGELKLIIAATTNINSLIDNQFIGSFRSHDDDTIIIENNVDKETLNGFYLHDKDITLFIDNQFIGSLEMNITWRFIDSTPDEEILFSLKERPTIDITNENEDVLFLLPEPQTTDITGVEEQIIFSLKNN